VRSSIVPEKPSISICIVNRNYGRFLDASIRSALAQTYPRVEVIAVDDGSTDDSRQVIARFGDRVRAVLQEHAGQAEAARAAAQAASGDVIVFLDSDDLLEPNVCDHVAAAFEREPELALVQWRLRTIDEHGEPLGRVLPPRPGLLPSGDLAEHVLRFRNWQYQLTTGVAYAAWAVRRLLPATLPEGEYHALDQWLNELAPLLGPVRSLDNVGGAHRIHGGNFSAFGGASGEWPRRMIRLTLNSHERVRQLAAELGRSCPEDARDLRDPAFLGWRLWSLVVDPANHPYPDDRHRRLATRGIAAALGHPHFPWRHRLKRAAWFAAVGTLPRSLTRRLIGWYAPDGPLSRA
jgi:glycosyltransferase involved in cell wall biosynthesis